MSDEQLRDELKTLMVAGLDTTALALSWSLYLLAINPDKDAKLYEEIASISGDGQLVAFASGAGNLVPGSTTPFRQLYAHDRQTGSTVRISVNSAGEMVRVQLTFPYIP